MMSFALKKLISLFSVLAVCVFMLSFISIDSYAADGVTLRLQKLKKYFPDGYYYNHQVNTDDDSRQHLLESRDESYALSVTKYPCSGHSEDSFKGGYDCNYFDGGYQCHGFASMLFYQIFGVRQSESEVIDDAPFDIRPGDLVRVKDDSHSVIVLSVKGDSFTAAECNVYVNDEAESCRIRWGETYPVSYISYYVRAKNYDEVLSDTAWKNIEDKKDVGGSFYAAIYSEKYDKALTADSKNNIKLKSYTGSASQVWKFTKLKNGSYKIENCNNGKVLALYRNEEGTVSVKALKAADKASQKWALYLTADGYYLSADSSSGVLTAKSRSSTGTGKKTADEKNLFEIKKKKTPVASKIKAKSSNGSVSLSWNKGNYTRSFEVRIYDEDSKLYKSYKKLTKTSLKVSLPSGNYSAKIISKNAFSETSGNQVHFTVSKKGELGKTAKVTATPTLKTISLSWQKVPGADGYIVAVKKDGKWKTLTATAETKYTVKELSAGKKYTFAIRAYNKKNGKTNLAKDMATFTSATKLKAASKLSASQTASSVTLKWSAVSKADGYRVYRKTSSGWVKHSDTTDNTLTIKKLTPGKNYTYGVRAYMKTSLGKVWGEIRSVNTATKPKAPSVSVSDVKTLRAKISWTKVSGADGYQVHYKINDDSSYTHLDNYSKTEGGVQLSGLTAGVEYTFSVRAYKKVGSKVIYGAGDKVTFRAKLFS